VRTEAECPLPDTGIFCFWPSRNTERILYYINNLSEAFGELNLPHYSLSWPITIDDFLYRENNFRVMMGDGLFLSGYRSLGSGTAGELLRGYGEYLLANADDHMADAVRYAQFWNFQTKCIFAEHNLWRQATCYILHLEEPGGLLSDVVLVHNESEAVGFGNDVLVMWVFDSVGWDDERFASEVARRESQMDALNAAVAELSPAADFGPFTTDDLIDNWEDVWAAVQLLDEEAQIWVRLGDARQAANRVIAVQGGDDQ